MLILQQELVDEIRARGEDALPMTAEEAPELTLPDSEDGMQLESAW